MFDVPPEQKCRLEWRGSLPIEENNWNVGAILGPSGCGKSSIARQVFAKDYHPALTWQGKSVIDDFRAGLSMEEIAGACQAVGFNTIPAWLRPFAKLSNGEQFRVELARRLLELPDPIVVDEFTSVVDRQVAQIGSHAIQKYVRNHNRKFVAVACHYDIIEWLQPDWIFEPATLHLARRSLQRRPPLNITIGRVPYETWQMFSPFHYMSQSLNRSARCWGLWVENRLAAFCAVLHRPHPKVDDISGISRVVTLPDFQGLGLAFVLIDKLGAAFKAVGRRLNNYPAHPAFVRAHDRSRNWMMVKRPGTYSSVNKSGSSVSGKFGGRPCATFQYIGPAMPLKDAQTLLAMGL